MSSYNNSNNSTIASIMMGSRRSPSGSTNNNNNNGEENMLISILCLFASDLIAGVGLKSFIRTFLRSHIPLIEFSTGIELNVSQQLEQHPVEYQQQDRLSILDYGSHEATQESTEFIIEIKGLKNRGQTCYANSVMQALASLQPLCTYLDALQQLNAHTHINCNGQGHQESVALALYQTIQYVNGHKVPRTKRRRTKSSFLPGLLPSLFSSSYTPGDPQRVMDLVAKHHSQFRSSNNMGTAGTLEQQDSHEFFSALMDVLSLEEQRIGDEANNMQMNHHTSDTNTNQGLACSNSFLRSGESVGDIISNNDDEFKESPDNAPDVHEEEKKHDDFINSDQKSVSESMTMEDNKLDAQQSQPTETRTATSSKSTIQIPFDGWSGSTIKCASCCHIRPIRSTPFLGLSLPIANIQSEFLEDFLSAEYGGFATAERVEEVQCFSCAIGQKVDELEEEDMLLNGAISSTQKRKRGKKTTQNGNDNSTYNDDDIAGLVEESQQIKQKIAILKALDPDADDDKLECTDEKDAQQEIELGINSSLPPISPLRGDAYKASLLMRPPQVLCIHIQRRHYEISCNRMVKVMRHVHFDEVLDLGAYCAYGENSFEKQRTFSTTKSRSRGARIPYKLMSVIEHQGNAFGGHYQTYRRVDPNQNDWAVVSDESIAFRTWNDVKRCQAYMLFYVAMSMK